MASRQSNTLQVLFKCLIIGSCLFLTVGSSAMSNQKLVKYFDHVPQFSAQSSKKITQLFDEEDNEFGSGRGWTGDYDSSNEQLKKKVLKAFSLVYEKKHAISEYHYLLAANAVLHHNIEYFKDTDLAERLTLAQRVLALTAPQIDEVLEKNKTNLMGDLSALDDVILENYLSVTRIIGLAAIQDGADKHTLEAALRNLEKPLEVALLTAQWMEDPLLYIYEAKARLLLALGESERAYQIVYTIDSYGAASYFEDIVYEDDAYRQWNLSHIPPCYEFPEDLKAVSDGYIDRFLSHHGHVGHRATIGVDESISDEKYEDLRDLHHTFRLSQAAKNVDYSEVEEEYGITVPQALKYFIRQQGLFSSSDGYGNSGIALYDANAASLFQVYHGDYFEDYAESEEDLYLMQHSITIGRLLSPDDNNLLLVFPRGKPPAIAYRGHDESFSVLGRFSIPALFKIYHEDFCENYPTLDMLKEG